MKGKKIDQVDTDITDLPLTNVISILKGLADTYGEEAYLELEEQPYDTGMRIVLSYYRDKTPKEIQEEERLKDMREKARKAQYERLKAEFEGEEKQ